MYFRTMSSAEDSHSRASGFPCLGLVEIRRDILEEPDGPMLRHGIQGFHGSRIIVPTRVTSQPNREFLAERYAVFLNAG